MKLKISYFVLLFLNLSLALSGYFYPSFRDQLYYLGQTYPNLLSEYYNSYLHINPRSGQFVTNLIARNHILRTLFPIFVFNGIIYVVYLLVFRMWPKTDSESSLKKYLSLCFLFIILIGEFGEMFYYVPYSGNYTFLNIFYLLYIFLLTEYYLYQRLVFRKALLPVLIVIAIFTGMGNEHVPPILLGFSILGGLYYLYKNRRLPSAQILVLNLSILAGYLLIFFAPAQSQRYHGAGKSPLQNGIHHFAERFTEIAKIYYYHQLPLLLSCCLMVGLVIFFRKHFTKQSLLRILIFVSMGFSALLIVSLSPIVGPRLLFFSNSLFISAIAMTLCTLLKKSKFLNLLYFVSLGYLLIFFGLSVAVTHHAFDNYRKTEQEILEKRKISKNVVLEKSFDFGIRELGHWNRKFLIDYGTDYIDPNPGEDNSMEKNLKLFYHLDSLSTK